MLEFLKCCFSNTQNRLGSYEELTQITVLEQTDYGGVQKRECQLRKGGDGSFYLKPLTGNCVSCFVDMPSVENWPASANDEPEFWRLVNEYTGGSELRSASYISNLLNDIALNIPHEKVLVNCENQQKKTVPDQIILDILRTGKISINSQIIYSPGDLEDKKEHDEVRAKLLFEKCMAALGGNYELTCNALKLTTQATMGHLGTLINFRFINQDLFLGIKCTEQSSSIEVNHELVNICYNTTWQVFSLEHLAIPKKMMRACVEISILKSDLERGTGKNAAIYEKCSPFFSGKDELDKYPLELLYPSQARDQIVYEERLRNYSDYFCLVPPFPYDSLETAGEVNFEKGCKAFSLITVNGNQIYCNNERSTNFDTSFIHILNIFENNHKVIKDIFELAFQSLPNYLKRQICLIFENKFLGRDIDIFSMELEINKNHNHFEVLVLASFSVLGDEQMNMATEIKGPLKPFSIEQTIHHFYISENQSKNQWIKV